MQKSKILENRQLYGSSYHSKSYQQNVALFQQYEVDEFNPVQNLMYKKLTVGLKAYTPNQLNQLSKYQKSRIIAKHNRAQSVLNTWKQSIVSNLVDDFFMKLFYRSKLIKDMVSYTKDYNTNFITCPQSFRELGIEKKDVVNKLMEANLLPHNFYSIK